MSETKTYVFPESGGNGGGSGMMAMLAPLLQQKGIDPNLLVAMQGKNNNGFGGDGSWFMWIIFLFFLSASFYECDRKRCCYQHCAKLVK